MEISTLAGQDLQGALPQLAALRIEVFRDFPYLYEGSLDYEESYLTALIESKDSIIVAAEDDGKIVGCAAGSALEGHHQEFAAVTIRPRFSTAASRSSCRATGDGVSAIHFSSGGKLMQRRGATSTAPSVG